MGETSIDAVQGQIENLARVDNKLETTLKPYEVFRGNIDTIQDQLLKMRGLAGPQAEQFFDNTETKLLQHLQGIAALGEQYVKLSKAHLDQEALQPLLSVKELNKKLAQELKLMEIELGFLDKIQKGKAQFSRFETGKKEWEQKLWIQPWEDRVIEGDSLLDMLDSLESELPLEEQLNTPELKEMLKELLHNKDTAEQDVSRNIRFLMLQNDPEQYKQYIEQVIENELKRLISDDNARQVKKQQMLTELWAVLDNSTNIQTAEIDAKVAEQLHALLEDIPYIIKVKGQKGEVYECLYKPAPHPRERGKLEQEAKDIISTYEHFRATDGKRFYDKNKSLPNVSIINGVLTARIEEKGGYYETLTVTPYEVTLTQSSDIEKDPKRAQAKAFHDAFEAWRRAGDNSTRLVFGDPPQTFDLRAFFGDPPIPKEKLTLFAIEQQLLKITNLELNQKPGEPDYITAQTAEFKKFIDSLQYNVMDGAYSRTNAHMLPHDSTTIFKYHKLGKKLFKSQEEYVYFSVLNNTYSSNSLYFGPLGKTIGHIVKRPAVDENSGDLYHETVTIEYFGKGKDQIQEHRYYRDGVLIKIIKYDYQMNEITRNTRGEDPVITIDEPAGEKVTIGSYMREKKLHPGLTVNGYFKMLAGALKDDKAMAQYITTILGYDPDRVWYKVPDYGDTAEQVIRHELHGRHWSDCDGYIRPLEKILAYKGIKAYPVMITTYDRFNPSDSHQQKLVDDEDAEVISARGRQVLKAVHTELIVLNKDEKGYYIESYGTYGVHINGVPIDKAHSTARYNTPQEALDHTHKVWDRAGVNFYTIRGQIDKNDILTTVEVLKDPALYPYVNSPTTSYERKITHVPITQLYINKRNKPKK